MSHVAEQLLRLSEELLDRSQGIPGLWHRASASLIRQTLEILLEQLWTKRAPGLEAASVRAQLACLPEFITTNDLARRVTLAWNELSTACHAHSYNLRPEPAMLESAFETLAGLANHPALGAPPDGSDGEPADG